MEQLAHSLNTSLRLTEGQLYICVQNCKMPFIVWCRSLNAAVFFFFYLSLQWHSEVF
jgi:hypothetical protein